MSVWILLFIFLVCSVPCLSENYFLRSNLTASKCMVNATVAIWCDVNSMITGSEDVLWYRKTGDSKQVLGQSSMLSVEFHEGRYKISLSKKTTTSVTYELIISPSKLHDSATIECVSPTSKQVTSANSFSFAVCYNLNSSFCNCIVAEGWASPKCNKIVEAAKAKKYESQRGCIGIAVCLAFMLAVALILTVMLVVNEVRSRLERERDRQAQMAEIEEANKKKLDQPSGPSILKKSKHNPDWNQPQIDPFSMSQLQQVPFYKLVAASSQSGSGFPQKNNKSNTSNSTPQAFSNAPNLHFVPKEGDVQYSDNFHHQNVQGVANSSRGAESQI